MSLLVGAALLILAAQGVQAQDNVPPVKVPVYEISTVRVNKTNVGGSRLMFTPDGLDVSGVPLLMLLREAYSVQDDQIIGAPSWAGTERFNIEAKVDGVDVPALKKLAPEQRRAMMPPVLEEHFKLKYHHETKELPAYVLVVAKGGSKLKMSEPDPLTPDGPKGTHMMRMGRGDITAKGISVANLKEVLSQQLGRAVVDQTGLNGNYDFELKWTPDDHSGGMFKGPDGGHQEAAPESSGPSIFTAVEEQLGLKLESRKVPMETLVIDHIEMPSEN